MTRQFCRKKQGKNVHIFGKIRHCVLSKYYIGVRVMVGREHLVCMQSQLCILYSLPASPVSCFTLQSNNMSTWRHIFYLPILLILGRQLILYLQDPSEAVNRVQSRLLSLKVNNEFEELKIPEEIVIAAVACGNIDRLGELSVMIKSAVIFSTQKPVKFIIFTDNLARDIEKILTYWKQFFNISWDIRPALYPPLTPTQESIKTEFAPCATQRLFFPQILPEYKYVLYVDTDILFLQDPDITWRKLQRMSDKSFGLVTENDDAL